MKRFFLFLFLIIGLVVLPLCVSRGFISILNSIIIYCLFSLSYNMLMGYSGMLSFGHGAYFTLGAYGVALLMTKLHWHPLLAFIAGPFISLLGAFVGGIICVKRSALVFVFLTLALSMVLYAVIYQNYDLTGGENGIIGVWPPAIIGTNLRYYYFTLFVVVLASVFIYIIVESPFGYSMRAIRENIEHAESIGINTFRCKLLIFVISGFFAGLAGSLYVFNSGGAFPSYTFWMSSAVPLVASIFGGPRFFFGPVIGTVIMQVIKDVVSIYFFAWQLCIGVITIVTVMFLPNGLMGIFSKR